MALDVPVIQKIEDLPGGPYGFMTCLAAAEELGGIDPTRILQLIEKGRIEAVRLGGKLLLVRIPASYWPRHGLCDIGEQTIKFFITCPKDDKRYNVAYCREASKGLIVAPLSCRGCKNYLNYINDED